MYTCTANNLLIKKSHIKVDESCRISDERQSNLWHLRYACANRELFVISGSRPGELSSKKAH